MPLNLINIDIASVFRRLHAEERAELGVVRTDDVDVLECVDASWELGRRAHVGHRFPDEEWLIRMCSESRRHSRAANQ